MHDTDTAVIADLCERMNVLRLRHGIVFRNLSPAVIPFIPLAESLAWGLAKEDKDAVIIARSLVDPTEQSRAEFWATPLGRLLFTAGGYPGETITQTLAAGLLGCSRQRVHQLVVKGDLKSAPVDHLAAREVFTGQVRALLRTKIDKRVK